MQDKRAYSRSGHFRCTARASIDHAAWYPVEVLDLSSGGMRFRLGMEFDWDAPLWVDLVINGYLSERRIKIKCSIRHLAMQDAVYTYGVRFEDLSPDTRIWIDENVRSYHLS